MLLDSKELTWERHRIHGKRANQGGKQRRTSLLTAVFMTVTVLDIVNRICCWDGLNQWQTALAAYVRFINTVVVSYENCPFSPVSHILSPFQSTAPSVCLKRQETICRCYVTFFIYEGFCKNQSTCYIYGKGSWDEGLKCCQQLHPKGRMITETSDEEAEMHIAETGLFFFFFPFFSIQK